MKWHERCIALVTLVAVGLSGCPKSGAGKKDGTRAEVGAGTAAAAPGEAGTEVSRPFRQIEIGKLIESLRYPNEVTVSFLSMIDEWKDGHQQPLIPMWRKLLGNGVAAHEGGKLTIPQLVEYQVSVARDLRETLQKEVAYDSESKELTDAVEKKRAQCVAYAQMFYVIGNSVGLNVDALDVTEPMTGVRTVAWGHVANLVYLADGRALMIDLVPGGFISVPFVLESQYRKVGNNLQMQDPSNPLGIHRAVRIIGRDGLIAAMYNNRGNACSRSRQLQRSIANYDMAIGLDPGSADAYNNRGVAFDAMGEYRKALADYGKAIELHPRFYEAYTNRGNSYSSIGDSAKAVADHNRALELNSEFAAGYTNRGNVYRNLGQLSEALRDHNKAIQLDANLADAYSNRGNVYYQMRRFEDAAADYRHAIGLRPEFAIAHHNLGMVLIDLRRFSEALVSFTKAIELDSNLERAYVNRGKIYAMDSLPSALRDFSEAIRLSPLNPEGYDLRAATYYQMGQLALAVRDWDKSLEINPKGVLTLIRRGVAYKDQGDHESAIRYYSKAIDLDPKNAEAYNYRGFSNVRLKKYPEARRDWERTIELDPSGREGQGARKNLEILKNIGH